jgi:hypothetical protein
MQKAADLTSKARQPVEAAKDSGVLQEPKLRRRVRGRRELHKVRGGTLFRGRATSHAGVLAQTSTGASPAIFAVMERFNLNREGDLTAMYEMSARRGRYSLP